MTLLTEIVAKRKRSLAVDRRMAQRFPERSLPIVPFFKDKQFLICEFKKASPTKGDFGVRDYAQLAKDYVKAGVTRFSVLTEREGFKGSLNDLYMLKKKYPKMGFLRKDFLFCEEDILHAYQAGADAVLLIAEILDDITLTKMIINAHRFGLQVLCEVHSLTALQRVLDLYVLPDAIGINARDLKTFKMQQDQPLRLRNYIPKGISVVYESGVAEPYLMSLIGNSHFTAALIGEAVVKSDKRVELIKDFKQAFGRGAKQQPNFFTKLYRHKKSRYIKVCGLTRKRDVLAAVKAGADVAGFIFSDRSPRCTTEKLLQAVKSIPILKVAVVQDPDRKFIAKLNYWLKTGLIDAVQFHGQEAKALVYSFQGNAYKATTDHEIQYLPVTLYDAEKTATMHKGQRINRRVYKHISGQWLAGGLTPQNVSAMIKSISPGLVDVNSGIEVKPGVKDIIKLKQFMKEVHNV